jgi:hypothetical protein
MRWLLESAQEYGLIISDYNSWSDWRLAVVHDGKVVVPINYQKRQWAFVPKSDSSAIHNAFTVHGVAFSRAGRELLPVVDTEPNEQYTIALKAFFDGQGMIMDVLK